MSQKVKNLLNNVVEFTALKKEIKHLEKKLEESKQNETPYIDKINQLKGENRSYKIQNTKLKNENEELKKENKSLEKKTKI